MKSLVVFLSMLLSATSFADNIETRPGSQIFLTIPNDSGATVQFSEPVKALSGGKQFRILPIGSDVDEHTQRDVNPQVFNIVAMTPNAEETITFVFGGREGEVRTLGIKFRAKEQASNFYNIKFPRAVRATGLNGFLSRETALMTAMIRDEDSYARQVFSQDLQIPAFPDLEFKAVRRFESDEFSGLVFNVSNKSKKSISINVAALSFGNSGRAVMAHVDNEVLSVCPSEKTKDPLKSSCQTTLRVVVRGSPDANSIGSATSFPFSKTTKED